MAKAPPSAKRDRIKAFTPALVDYTNDVVYGTPVRALRKHIPVGAGLGGGSCSSRNPHLIIMACNLLKCSAVAEA